MKFDAFKYKAYNPYHEFVWNNKTVYLYSDDDLNECALVVDSDNNILSDSPTSECACIGCRENSGIYSKY